MSKKSVKKILVLEYITILWNVIEGIVAVAIGIVSGSISLLAFGLESGIEVFSSSITVWELKGIGNGRKDLALKMISFAFIFVSLYIAITAVNSFFELSRPEPTIMGIMYMFLVSLIMLVLGYLKRVQGRIIKNRVVIAESNFTFLDVALSGSILLGLLLNYFLGWWWVDRILALIIASNAFFQGIKGLWEKGKKISAEAT